MDFFDISLFRFFGLLAGLYMIVVGVRGMRRVSAYGPVAVMTILSGVFVLIFSLFPGMATLITDILQMGSYPGSRLIALIIIAIVAMGMATAAFGAQSLKTKDHLDRLIRKVALDDFERDTPEASVEPGSVIAILPALNEEKNVAGVLSLMPKDIDGVRVYSVVVDDGSADDTAGAAKAAGAFVVRSPFQRGQGAAIRLGYEAAERFKASVAVNIDADGQNDPREMIGLVRPILNDEADVVIGSRILGSHEITHWWRHVGVKFFSAIFNILLDGKITDISSGYRAVRVSRLPALRLYQDQYQSSEFIIMCAKLGFRISESPIHFARRTSGKSKKGNEFLYGVRFARALLTTWVRSN